MSLPLDGIRIIDWTVGQFGPVATSMLGDLGADVIKLEQPVKGDPGRGMQTIMGRSATGLPEGRNYYFENNNRSKRGITVDVTKEEGREIIYRMVKTADVFVCNLRRHVAPKVGLDYKTLSKYNPKLIYATANAFGPDGPDSDKPGVDYVAAARSGLMTSVGEPGMPPLVTQGGIVDQSGAVFLGYSIVIALLARERLGIGQEVNVSLLGSSITIQGLNVAAYTILGSEIGKHDRARVGNPLWNHYKCADGKWLAFAMLWADRCWPDFCRVIGIQHLKNDPKFISMDARRANAEELISILDDVLITRPRHEWIKIFDEALTQGADIIYSILNTISDLPDDPQVMANKYITNFNHPVFGDTQVVGLPYKFSETPGVVGGSQHREAPELGQHTEEVLLELGYTWEDITLLKDKDVI
jgi:crotonobetainyl-CoA:carnitine CoA-transferase CaiB-like acyl-CoA transferase